MKLQQISPMVLPVMQKAAIGSMVVAGGRNSHTLSILLVLATLVRVGALEIHTQSPSDNF